MTYDATPVGTVNDPGFLEDKSRSDHQHQLFSVKSNLVLENVWTNVNVGNPLRIKRAADFCVIEGVVKATAGGARAQTIADLPSDCLPFAVYYYPVDVAGTWYYVVFDPALATISTNIPNATAVAALSLHGLFYRTV